MSNSRRDPVLLVAAICGLLGARGFAQETPSPSDPLVTIERLRSEVVELRRNAVTALRESGKESMRAALPVLIELLKSEKDGQVRLAVLDAMIDLGPDAAPAIPALVHTLRTDYGGQSKEELHQDYRSALALAAIGKPAVDGLQGLLVEKKVNVRAEAAMALGRIGPVAEAAIPALIRSLGDESDRVRREASLALGRIGETAVEPLLISAISDNANIRYGSVEALGHLPNTDPRVRKALLERVGDEVPAVRARALAALGHQNLPADLLVPIMERAMSDPDEAVRLATVNLLVERRDVIGRMISRLESLLEAEDPGVSRHAAFLLGAIGPDAAPTLLNALGGKKSRIDQIAAELAQLGRPVVDRLQTALKAEDPRVRRGAALALGQLRPLSPGTVEMLSVGLHDPDPEVRVAFLTSLGFLGPRAAAAVPDVRSILRDESAEIREQAIEVLFHAAPRDERLLADLTTCLDDQDTRVQRRALEAIRAIGPLGREALPAAIKMLSSPDRSVRRAAAELIGSHGPSSAQAVPALGALLDDPSPEVRTIAVQTLGNLGKAAQSAFPRLVPLLSDQSAQVRIAVVDTLWSLELDAAEIRPHLSRALGDEQEEVRKAATRSVFRLGPQGAVFLPDLIRLTANPEDRRSVERVLRRFERTGPDPRSVPELVELLGHAQEPVRLLAIKFLGLAGPAAREALPALERLKDDPSSEVRRQAEAALERIKSSQSSE